MLTIVYAESPCLIPGAQRAETMIVLFPVSIVDCIARYLSFMRRDNGHPLNVFDHKWPQIQRNEIAYV